MHPLEAARHGRPPDADRAPGGPLPGGAGSSRSVRGSCTLESGAPADRSRVLRMIPPIHRRLSPVECATWPPRHRTPEPGSVRASAAPDGTTRPRPFTTGVDPRGRGLTHENECRTPVLMGYPSSSLIDDSPDEKGSTRPDAPRTTFSQNYPQVVSFPPVSRVVSAGFGEEGRGGYDLVLGMR